MLVNVTVFHETFQAFLEINGGRLGNDKRTLIKFRICALPRNLEYNQHFIRRTTG